MKKPTVKLTCGLCTEYIYSDSSLWETYLERSVSKHFRVCNFGKRVDKYSDICERFNPSHFFPCEKEDNIQHVDACMSRQTKKTDGCVNCKQGKQIRLLLLRLKSGRNNDTE